MISPRVDLRDLRDDPVHELPVVRGHQHRARIRLQKLLQPDNRFDIQVIGRLVHQQHIRPAEQHPRQRHAHLPPARQRAHIAIDLVVFESQAVQHLARLRFQIVAAQMLVFLLHLAEPLQDAIHFVGPRGIVPWRGAVLPVRDADRPPRRSRRSLRRAPNGPSSPPHPAGNSRWSASWGPKPRLRRALPRPRPCETAWSCRPRSGPPAPPSRRGSTETKHRRRSSCLPYCLLILERNQPGRRYSRSDNDTLMSGFFAWNMPSFLNFPAQPSAQYGPERADPCEDRSQPTHSGRRN